MLKKENFTKNRFNIRGESDNLLEKRDSLHKLENVVNENKLEKKKKLLSEKLKELKSDKTSAINTMVYLYKEIENDKAEIEVLENFNKFTDGLGVVTSAKNYEKIKHARGSIHSNELFIAASNAQRDSLKRERDCKGLKEELIRKSTLIDTFKQKEKEIKKYLKTIREDLGSIKTQLNLHYHVLLHEGKDTRQEGLVWIIKAIWNLGFNVIMSYLPTFLDEKGIEFLFTLAHKDFELQKLKTLIEEIKSNLKQTVIQKKIEQRRGAKKVNSETTFRTQLKANFIDVSTRNNNVHNSFFLIQYSENSPRNSEKTFDFQTIEEIISKKEKLTETTLEFLKRIEELENKHNALKVEITILKKNELSRISKEFLTSDYERRFNITQPRLIAAITGEDHMNSEYTRQMRDHKVSIFN